MSNIYEIIDSLDLKEEDNKLQIYLIKNPKEEKSLLSALTSLHKTEESKRNLLKGFLHTIPGMLDKIFVVTTVCDAITNPFLFFITCLWI